ncbi:MAG: PilZ domain-containing protein [Candidatus Methylomirabilales bacterium]
MQQQFRRKPFTVPVAYQRLDQEKPSRPELGWTEDLGEGGACIKLAAALPVGCQLKLVLFTHRTRRDPVEAKARVVWAKVVTPQSALHGVEFFDLSPTQQSTLRQALIREQPLPQELVRLPIALPVQCHVVKSSQPPMLGSTHNISPTGVMLSLPMRLTLGAAVKLTFQTPTRHALHGMVRWVDGEGAAAGSIRHGIELLGGPLSFQEFQGLLLGAITTKQQGNTTR